MLLPPTLERGSLEKKNLGWCDSGLSAGQPTKGAGVRLPLRAHAPVVDQVPPSPSMFLWDIDV